MLDKVKDRIRLQFNERGIELLPNYESDILLHYEINFSEYDDKNVDLIIEDYLKNIDDQISVWKESRRPSVFASKVDFNSMSVAMYPKSEEVSQFLISQLSKDIPFKLITEEQKKDLVASMYPISVKKGTYLIEEGTMGSQMFIIESGEFNVTVNGELSNKLVRGSVFGELSLLHGIPRTASVIATRDSEVWAAEQTAFTCIRVKDQVYRNQLVEEALLCDRQIMKILKTKEMLEIVVHEAKYKYVSAHTPVDLLDNEVAVVLKPAEIIDECERRVNVKDLVKVSFFVETDIEIGIVKIREPQVLSSNYY